MKIDWSTTGHKLPDQALRSSDSLTVPHREKARASRIAWERAEAGLEPFYIITQRVVAKVQEAQNG